MKRYIRASEEMSYQEFKDKYEYACKKWPDIKDGYGRNYTVTETQTEYQKSGSKWQEVGTTTEVIPFIDYVRSLDANSFFKGFGKEKVDTGYTIIGKVPIRVTSTDPSGSTKVVRTYKITNGVSASTDVSSRTVMASAWSAPNGKKYGKQTRRFPGKYLFTRRELKDMVDSGIAEDMAGTFDPMAMNYDIIGIAWNDTNGYRSGILIQDRDTGELYVGNSGDATRAKL